MSSPSPYRVSSRRLLQAAVATVLTLATSEVGAAVLEPHLPKPLEWPNQQVSSKVKQIEKIAAAGTKVDVVFLGSSVVVQGIDPVAFNGSGSTVSYNAALDGSSPRAWVSWAGEVVLPKLDPEVLVIGITSRDLNDGGAAHEEFLLQLQASEGFRRLNQDSVGGRILRAIANHSALWRIRLLFRQPGTTLVQLLGEGPATPRPGPFGAEPPDVGALAYDNTGNWREFWRNRHFNDYSIGGEELDALQVLIDQSLGEGRDVIVVEMPIHNDYYVVQPHGQDGVREFQETVESLAATAHATVLDLTDRFPATDFRDPAHLRPDAAQRLAVTIADRISALAAQP